MIESLPCCIGPLSSSQAALFREELGSKLVIWSSREVAQYLDEFCLAMDIHTMTDSTISNAENDRDESQESQVTFGSWRTVDDDDIGEVKDEWKIYLDAPRVKDYKDFLYTNSG